MISYIRHVWVGDRNLSKTIKWQTQNITEDSREQILEWEESCRKLEDK